MTAVYLALISLACYSSKRILQRLNYTRQLSLILLALRFIEKIRVLIIPGSFH